MSKFKIQNRVLGAVGTNVYFLTNTETREALIVDPADNAPYILEQCKKLGCRPAAILLTHGHFDHIFAVNELRQALQVPVYAHEAEADLLGSATMNRSAAWAVAMSTTADVLVKDRQLLELAGFKIQVIYTPGHTAGSCCYYFEEEKVLISGDTLFCESYGRTDLETGSESAILHSLQHRLLILPEDVEVYPGHMNPTTIGHEKKFNPAAF